MTDRAPRWMTFWEQLDGRAEDTPDASVVVDDRGRGLAAAELRAAVLHAAAGIHRLGIEPGDRIVWRLPGWVETLVLVGALARLDVVQVPVASDAADDDVADLVAASHAALLVLHGAVDGDPEAAGRRIASAAPACDLLLADRALPQGDPGRLPVPGGTTDAERWYLPTRRGNGRTAARHGDGGLDRAGATLAARTGLGPDDRVLLACSPAAPIGLAWAFACLRAGACMVLVDQPTPEACQAAAAEHGATVVVDPAELVLATTGVRHHVVDATTAARSTSALRVLSLPEAPVLAADAAGTRTGGTAGVGVEIRVVTDEGKEAGFDELGELRIRGAQVAVGHLDAAVDDAAVDDDGWCRTSLRGRLDADGVISLV